MLDERELGRGETCCPGDVWDLTGGDTMDVPGKAGGLIKVPRDSSTLDDRELSRGETCCPGDIWDLIGGDFADAVEAKRFLKSPGDSLTLDA